jgi:V8-like Glu-specific endopeptidase
MRSNYLIYIATIFNLRLQKRTSQSIINDDINANSRDAEDKAHVRRRKLRYSYVFSRDDGDNILEREKRVVGGQIAVANRYPYYAYLKGEKGISCGGTLIAPDIVLTAAHCG